MVTGTLPDTVVVTGLGAGTDGYSDVLYRLAEKAISLL